MKTTLSKILFFTAVLMLSSCRYTHGEANNPEDTETGAAAAGATSPTSESGSASATDSSATDSTDTNK
ncbi:hypothetical protein [Flavobacterium sp.]|uniref:hypothetical protein n=1 Tax=Flavobacterium sp. TaxID=239 RepID=UPI001225B503|nr:hypothetical protein [Flavobacterium sp.]RZJ70399.1 MAG: hypothetical protein EOO49_14050 [Flavobacterium sp.]